MQLLGVVLVVGVHDHALTFVESRLSQYRHLLVVDRVVHHRFGSVSGRKSDGPRTAGIHLVNVL